MNLNALGTSCKWDHTVFVLLWLAISLSIMSTRFIHVVAYVRFSFLFKGWIILHYMYVPYFVYPFIHWWIRIISNFWLLWMMLLWTNISSKPCFQFFWVYTRSGTAGSYGFLKENHTSFYSSCITLHFHSNIILKYFLLHSSPVTTKGVFLNQKKRIIFYVPLPFRNCLHKF